jgi:hypothetical protein
MYSAAEALDALLGQDDGALLASMAHYKTSLLELFGRDGIVEILRQSIDEAAHVDYYSKRSRREIDPRRPEVSLRVDDVASMLARGEQPYNPQTASGRTDEEHTMIARYKTDVIFEQVCRPMASRMNAALTPHWEKAKTHLTERGVDPNLARLLLCNMFVVRIGQDPKMPALDKMCTLGIVV